MKLQVNKNQFISNILNPVSKLSDNLIIAFSNSETNQYQLKTITNSADNSVILFAQIPCNVESPVQAVIPDCKTFLRLFSGIDKDNVVLNFEQNAIYYNDNSFSFKYHLLDESYVSQKKSISEEKLNSLHFDTQCSITKQKLSEIVKYNSIVPDAEKLYFFTDEKRIFVKLGDEQRTGVNEVNLEVSEQYRGTQLTEKCPISISNVLLFSFSEEFINVSINHQLKVFKFESEYAKYIVSGLVK